MTTTSISISTGATPHGVSHSAALHHLTSCDNAVVCVTAQGVSKGDRRMREQAKFGPDRRTLEGRTEMATQKQVKAAKRNVTKAQAGAQKKRSIAKMPAKTRTALGKQGAAVAQRKRTGGRSPKTRQELYEIAKRRDLPGRSKMGRAELASALGYK
jgi:hypothetical protein